MTLKLNINIEHDSFFLNYSNSHYIMLLFMMTVSNFLQAVLQI